MVENIKEVNDVKFIHIIIVKLLWKFN